MGRRTRLLCKPSSRITPVICVFATGLTRQQGIPELRSATTEDPAWLAMWGEQAVEGGDKAVSPILRGSNLGLAIVMAPGSGAAANKDGKNYLFTFPLKNGDCLLVFAGRMGSGRDERSDSRWAAHMRAARLCGASCRRRPTDFARPVGDLCEAGCRPVEDACNRQDSFDRCRSAVGPARQLCIRSVRGPISRRLISCRKK